MNIFVLRSWLLLFYFEILIQFCDFKKLRDTIQDYEVAKRASVHTVAQLCRAIDLACVFYFKRVMCLQRSAATTALLRHYGWRAKLVIGTKLLPFQSHAWVEIDDDVVNDKPYMLEIYRVLERC
jgi:Transglutaminase-like superfamily